MEKEVFAHEVARLSKMGSGYRFDDFRVLMEILRSPDGCPWDNAQTHKTIRNDLIEETYEVIEAIDKEDTALLREELGDVMMQILFHSRIEEEQGTFSVDDVINDVCVKLIRRHPHVFGNVNADTADAVLANWEAIKNEEKARKTTADSMRSVPPMLPALMRAQKIGKKAAKVGFDFPDAMSALKKVYEEADEIKGATGEEEIFSEVGDLLLSAVNVGRLLGVDCERALNASSEKFIRRFSETERLAAQDGRRMEDLSLAESDEYYQKAKNAEKKE